MNIKILKGMSSYFLSTLPEELTQSDGGACSSLPYIIRGCFNVQPSVPPPRL